jgi:polysaccharide deacetylase family protein (PEP-CTERM system associated)
MTASTLGPKQDLISMNEDSLMASGTERGPLSGVMSIDVEDWFQVENLRPVVSRESWASRELRVERNMDRMLGLMADCGAHATCFVLGWVAERCPGLVQRIASEGHEIASHGYGHELLYDLSPDDFRSDIRRSKQILEDTAGIEVKGYRAPNFSITDWAIPILQEEGFTYDSSLFPSVAHDRYGKLTGLDPERPVVELRPGFHEFCASCLPVAGKNLPWGGGAYFRLIPYRVFRHGVHRIQATRPPYVFYIHPWEIDPAQPRLKGIAATRRFRHYVGLERTERRFASLLGEFSWSTILEVQSRQAEEAARRGR